MARPLHRSPPVPRAGGLLRARRGELYVEYLVVMAFFALPVAAACLALGFPLLRLFRYAQLALVGPFP
jgi:hypothetical protein